MSRVGLHMIVKNEAHVIERCLASVRPLIDWWVISDTGSTDGTQDVVRAALAGIPGRLIERPWVAFGHNRDEALVAARDLPESRPGDYTMWLDADEELIEAPDVWPDLTAQGYLVQMQYGEHRYARLALVRLDAPWRWTGALHEYLDLPGADIEHLSTLRFLVRHEGARSLDPETYRRDALVLQEELRARPDDPRLQFYLGQTWGDAREPALALKAYLMRRDNTEGWDQERWMATLCVARCLEHLDRPPAEVARAYLEAYSMRPTRAEPLVDLARYERLHGRPEVALVYARAAAALSDPPVDDMFVDEAAHTWRSLDEIALSCWPTQRFDEGRAAARAALMLRPGDPRLVENLDWYERREHPDPTP